MKARHATGVGLLALLTAVLAAPGLWSRSQDAFEHLRHKGLFPTCEGCHRIEPGGVTIPAQASCADCHDGTVQRKVDWTPAPPPPSNLDFNHAEVFDAIRREEQRDVACGECHTPHGAPRMDVRRAIAELCMDCHAKGASHYVDAPCEECHLPLAEATRLPPAKIADLPLPEDHRADDFLLAVHGPAAPENLARCAVCHAREFCSDCHVNAPSVRAIQELPRDPRVAELAAASEPKYPVPPSHRPREWWQAHASTARADGAACETCHARTSCETCHSSPLPPAVRRLPPPEAEPGGDGPAQERGRGVRLERKPPPTHTPTFAADHRAPAAAATAQCEVCHTTVQCTSCHTASQALNRPGQPVGRYHPANFLQQHSAAAFGRDVECASCHNPEAFCRDCHSNLGLRSDGRFDTGFHDRDPRWVFGHGQAARQGLESCATCHAQRDCLQCHSALGGRRVNPHGPGFDAERLRSKNPELCLRCHRPSILNP